MPFRCTEKAVRRGPNACCSAAPQATGNYQMRTGSGRRRRLQQHVGRQQQAAAPPPCTARFADPAAPPHAARFADPAAPPRRCPVRRPGGPTCTLPGSPTRRLPPRSSVRERGGSPTSRAAPCTDSTTPPGTGFGRPTPAHQPRVRPHRIPKTQRLRPQASAAWACSAAAPPQPWRFPR